ncbi:MAG: arsenite methyltransferase [Chitinophagales bacterium]
METLISVATKTNSNCCNDSCCAPLESSSDLKEIVKEKYGAIAEGNIQNCCEGSCCGGDEITSIADSYADIGGHFKDADLNLGCGLPTQFARIKKGDTVVDLGSGAGNDCFIARHETGETGKVIGIDLTEAMIRKARSNAFKVGYNNVEFIQGDIENVPLPDNIADVVVSNCVFNLVPEKKKAFEETFRILKPGGHFSISDVVTIGELPEAVKRDAELYVGCIAGAIEKQNYLDVIAQAGFQNISLQMEKSIDIPNEILKRYLSDEQLSTMLNHEFGICSITVYAKKPE